MRFSPLLTIVVVIWKIAEVKAQHQRTTDTGERNFLATVIPTAFNPRTANSRCREDSLMYAESILRSTDWAWKMLGASGRLSDIYLSSNHHSMGHYDQCLAVTAPSFLGKYCTVRLESQGPVPVVELLRKSSVSSLTNGISIAFEPNSTSRSTNFIPPSIGLCVPSSCGAADLQAALAHSLALQLGNLSSSIDVVSGEEMCYTYSHFTAFDATDIATGIAFSVLAAVVISGTCIDGWGIYVSDREESLDGGDNNALWMKTVVCFSLIRNGRQLFSTSSSNSRSLQCVHGIRFLTMSWVVVSHVWIQGVLQYNQNIDNLLEDGRKWYWQSIANGTVAVDGFFLLGGLLVCYNLLQYLERNKGKMQLAAFYIHRYIRLAPVYIAVFAFVSTLLAYVGSGPNWNKIKQTCTNCRRVWWQQLLFINNFVSKGADEQCMTETWYLSNDFQLFLISPLLVYPIWRWKSKGLVVLFALTFLSLAGNVTLFYTKEMPPTSMITRPLTMSRSLLDFWVLYYPQPWFRAPPYFVGIFLGHVLYTTQDQTVRLSKLLLALGWIFSCATCLLVVYGLSWFTDEELVPHIPTLFSVIYGSFHRFAWGLALAWIIFACVHGFGGLINDFLSWKLFIPLARTSYCTYLIHYNVISVYYAQKRSSSFYTPLEQFYSVCGNWTFSLLMAIIVCLTVEMPFLNLERITSYRSSSRCRPLGQKSCGKINEGFTIA